MKARLGVWRLCVVLAGGVVLLSGCTSFEYRSERREGLQPRPGTIGVASVGDPVIVQYAYEASPGAVILDRMDGNFFLNIIDVPVGAHLRGGVASDEDVYCSGLAARCVCFIDEDGDGRFDHFRAFDGYGNLGPRSGLVEPLRYRPKELSDMQGFKYELLYQGRSGSELNISYREYSDDLARPAFQQELHYTLALSGETQIGFRSVRIRVISADNQSMRYEVLSGFISR